MQAITLYQLLHGMNALCVCTVYVSIYAMHYKGLYITFSTYNISYNCTSSYRAINTITVSDILET